jgi:flagellar motility protein MotE (MotC chaperone)
VPASPTPAKIEKPGRPAGGEAERQLHRKLKQERKEMALLRDEMKRRLKEQLANRQNKLGRLAAQCEKLEPGEAAQVLLSLDDAELAEVLRRIERDTALKIAALLERLGRKSTGAIQ